MERQGKRGGEIGRVVNQGDEICCKITINNTMLPSSVTYFRDNGC